MSIDPQQIINQSIKPQYHQYFKDWLNSANEKEAKGLQLIGQILKHEGKKKFRALPPSVQLKRLTQQEDFDFRKAEEMFRKNQTTTAYQSEFCQQSKDIKPKNNIFKFKKCSQLEFAESLTQQTVNCIDNWIDLNDDLEFQELVLACLRSFNAKVKAQRVSQTEKQAQFIKNTDWELIKPLRTDKAGQQFKAHKTNQGSLLRQQQKQEELQKKLQELEEKEGKEKLEMIIKKSFKI